MGVPLFCMDGVMVECTVLICPIYGWFRRGSDGFRVHELSYFGVFRFMILSLRWFAACL